MKAFFSLAFLAVAVCSSANGLQIAFSARNLPSRDPFDGAPDGYINVYYAPNPQTQYIFIGRTDDISDNRNPDWPELFSFTYSGGTAQRLKVDLYDADWPDADDYMGNIEFSISDLVNSFGGTITRSLIGGNPEEGQLIVRLVTPKTEVEAAAAEQKVISGDEEYEKRMASQEALAKLFDPRLRHQMPAPAAAPASSPVKVPESLH